MFLLVCCLLLTVDSGHDVGVQILLQLKWRGIVGFESSSCTSERAGLCLSVVVLTYAGL